MEPYVARPLTIWPIIQFDKEYDVHDKLGQGKFGAVFKVKKKRPKSGEEDVFYAAKFMACEKASEKLRVRDEIEILHMFEHPNVLKLIAAHEDSDNFIQGREASLPVAGFFLSLFLGSETTHCPSRCPFVVW